MLTCDMTCVWYSGESVCVCVCACACGCGCACAGGHESVSSCSPQDGRHVTDLLLNYPKSLSLSLTHSLFLTLLRKQCRCQKSPSTKGAPGQLWHCLLWV